jgi:8-oxo-dGTP pyrophosphatase MutT (NUDIX family)
MARWIRNLAVGLPRRDDHLFVSLGSDRITGARFCRAIGGGIDFGERASDALIREFREELGVEVTPGALLGVMENLFEFEGEQGHEIVHVFELESADLDRVDLEASLTILDVGSPARWYRIADLRTGAPPLYPAGILDLIT